MFRKEIRKEFHGVSADDGHVLVGSWRGGRCGLGGARGSCAQRGNAILDILCDLDTDFHACCRQGIEDRGTPTETHRASMCLETEGKAQQEGRQSRSRCRRTRGSFQMLRMLGSVHPSRSSGARQGNREHGQRMDWRVHVDGSAFSTDGVYE